MISSSGPAIAIRATLYLALQPRGTRATVRHIATHTGLPEPYLAKVVGQLAAAGLVRAFRGPGGGVALIPDPKTVTLWTVARSVDPAVETEWCVMGLQPCSRERTCPLHERCAPLRAAMRGLLEETTIASLTNGLRRKGRFGSVPWFHVPEGARRPAQASGHMRRTR